MRPDAPSFFLVYALAVVANGKTALLSADIRSELHVDGAGSVKRMLHRIRDKFITISPT
jgi:hypothetical protein